MLGYFNVLFEVVERVIEVGVIGFIYLYNVMLLFIFCELGMVGVVFLSNNICGIIVDY